MRRDLFANSLPASTSGRARPDPPPRPALHLRCLPDAGMLLAIISAGLSMKHVLRRHALFLWLAVATAFGLPQVVGTEHRPVIDPDGVGQDVKLPNGKSQRDEILKAEHEENLRDAARLVEMAQDLKADLEKNDTRSEEHTSELQSLRHL